MPLQVFQDENYNQSLGVAIDSFVFIHAVISTLWESYRGSAITSTQSFSSCKINTLWDPAALSLCGGKPLR